MEKHLIIMEKFKMSKQNRVSQLLLTKNRCAGRMLQGETPDLWPHSLHGLRVSEQEAQEPKGGRSGVALKEHIKHESSNRLVWKKTVLKTRVLKAFAQVCPDFLQGFGEVKMSVKV